MTPAVRQILLGSPFSPYRLQNNAAAYSLSGAASDSTYLTGASGLYYVADRSGNSSVNGLVLPGVASNYASAPDAAPLRITGDIEIIARVSLNDWTPSAQNAIIGRRSSGSNISYILSVKTTGALELNTTVDGGTDRFAVSSVAPTVSDYGALWIRVTRASATGTTKFYTAPDSNAVPSSWTQLGTDIATTAGAIFAGTAALEIGSMNSGGANSFSGIIYRAQIYNGIAGTLAFDANFTTAAKFATSFTESSSNAATMTINQTAIALPARIHGARDLYQHLTASMPAFSVSGGYNIATFDGTADYLKSAPYSLSQPESVYFVGSQVSWTNSDYLYDGNANDTMAVVQFTTTPNLISSAGGGGPQTTSLAVGVRGVISSVMNTTASSVRINAGAAVTASAGSSNGSGFTLGARAAATFPSNITWSEALIRSAADAEALQLRIAAFEMRKWGIS
jgi:hypothetical protein